MHLKAYQHDNTWYTWVGVLFQARQQLSSRRNEDRLSIIVALNEKSVEFFHKRELKSIPYCIYQVSFLGETFIYPVTRLITFVVSATDTLRSAPLYLMSADSVTSLSLLTFNTVFRCKRKKKLRCNWPAYIDNRRVLSSTKLVSSQSTHQKIK